MRFAVRLLRCFVLLCACALQFNPSWMLGVLFDACGRSLEVRSFLHSCKCVGRATIFFKMLKWGSTLVWFSCLLLRGRWQTQASQRSLHNEPIFRLLLKVAVKGTQQCEFRNFCGASCPNEIQTQFAFLRKWLQLVRMRTPQISGAAVSNCSTEAAQLWRRVVIGVIAIYAIVAVLG